MNGRTARKLRRMAQVTARKRLLSNSGNRGEKISKLADILYKEAKLVWPKLSAKERASFRFHVHDR